LKQVRLVFWKDVRHLWPELTLYAVLLVVYAVAAPQVWLGKNPNQFLAMFVTLLKVLIAVSWLVLIERAVHADNLVGEEQFWITRPYHWQSLLAAKMLFVAVCVTIPFVVMQWAMLLEAGLNPFTAKAGMALCLLRFVSNAWLPLLVAASVTENLAMMFTFIAAMMVAWAGLLTFIMSSTDMRMSPPYSLAVFLILFGGLMVAILIYQYARRRTIHSRLAIVAFLALFLLMIFGFDRGGFGAPVKALIRAHYTATDSLRLVFGEAVPYEKRSESRQVPRDQVEVKLPVQIQGLPQDAKLRETNIAVEVEGGGTRYAPPWQNATVSEHAVGFVMPKDVFERFVSVETRLHLELLAEELRPARVVKTTVAEKFPGPMDGVCLLIQGKVYCRYPYREWVPARVAIDGCGGPMTATLRHVPAGGILDPVVNEALPFSKKVCVGDTIRFTEYGVTNELRLALDAPVIRIEQYRAQ
jgi:hypothetical protein